MSLCKDVRPWCFCFTHPLCCVQVDSALLGGVHVEWADNAEQRGIALTEFVQTKCPGDIKLQVSETESVAH
jgi:hypothetical protein